MSRCPVAPWCPVTPAHLNAECWAKKTPDEARERASVRWSTLDDDSDGGWMPGGGYPCWSLNLYVVWGINGGSNAYRYRLRLLMWMRDGEIMV